MSKLMNFRDLLVLIEEDPITGGNAARDRNVGVRRGAYESSVAAGALYRSLKHNPAMTNAFYALPFWHNSDGDKKTYVKNPVYLNKHCHQFVYGAREGSEGKRAEDHGLITQSFLDDEDRTLEELLAALDKAGFDGLRKAIPAQRARMAKAKADSAVQSDQENDEADLANAGGSGKPPITLRAAAAAEPPKKPKWILTMKQVFDHLLVTMEPSELQMFLEPASEVGDNCKIIVERDVDTKTGGLVWRATDIEFLAPPLD